MSNWTQLELLNPDDLWDYRLPQAVNDNLTVIRNLLITAGYTVSELTAINFSAGYGMDRTTHKAALNAVEANIDALEYSIDFYLSSYGQAVSYDIYYPTIDQLNRWINICNQLMAILNGSEAAPVPLYYDADDILYYTNNEIIYYPDFISDGGN